MGEEFKIGDVVKLMSGGPAMTVCRIRTADSTQLAMVYFHVEGGKNNDGNPASLQAAELPFGALRKVGE